jgi:tetratricopeptide (TPR) repeat protein
MTPQERFAELIELYDGMQYGEMVKKATQLSIDYPYSFEVWNILAVGYKALGETAEAEIGFRKAAELNPNFAKAFYNLGITLHDQGKFDHAISAYRRALDVEPSYAAAWYNMGNTLGHQGKHGEAVAAYARAIEINPAYLDAYRNMGNAYKDQGKFDDAIEAYQHALSLKPNNEEVYYNNMGLALNALGRLDEALVAYERALALNPDFADAHNNMGITLRECGNLDAALIACERALALNPDLAEGYNHLGLILKQQGNLDRAIIAFERGHNLKPNDADINNNLGQACLLNNNFSIGFRLFEWRWKMDLNRGKALISSRPVWNGENGKRLLLWGEQGIGDEIMFASMIQELETICSKLIVACDPRLIPVFQRSFSPNTVFHDRKAISSEDDYDFHIPMGSVATILRPSLDRFEISAKPYLSYRTERSKELRDLLLQDGAKRIIGISWNTTAPNGTALHRNISLEQLAGHLPQGDTMLVNLQYGDVSEQISQVREKRGIKVAEVAGIDNRADIEGLADLIAACDHVVSIDNSTVHLAGALGIATSALLPLDPNWRWGLHGKKSYWYDSLTLYRQQNAGEWNDVLDELQSDLCNL